MMLVKVIFDEFNNIRPATTKPYFIIRNRHFCSLLAGFFIFLFLLQHILISSQRCDK